MNEEITLFPELPALNVRQIVLCVGEGRDVAALSCTCKALKAVCEEPGLWRELVIRRFGPVLPGTKPSREQTQPVTREGWVFYQGLDGSEETDQQFPGASVQQLAEKALGTADGAEAFTTSGKLISLLKPQDTWQHFSFRPSEGMYVRQEVVHYRGLREPAEEEPGEWPPVIPGWVYCPSCLSPGHAIHEAPASLANHKTLKELMAACQNKPEVVAVSTAGETKHKLLPQACWQVHPSYDVGLYVREEVAAATGLVPNPPVPDYRALYAKLQQLKLDAAHMSAAWLNDQYLSLRPVPDSPAASGMALVLNHVWWLDVSGSIPGVPPGSYNVSWVVDVVNTRTWHNTVFTLSAEAHPTHPCSTAAANGPASSSNCSNSPAGTAVEAAAAAAAGGGGSGAAGQSTSSAGSVSVQIDERGVLQLRQQCQQRQQQWGRLSGGVLNVTQVSTVHLRFFSIEGTFKGGIRWAYAELTPVGSELQNIGVTGNDSGSGSNAVGGWRGLAGMVAGWLNG